MAEDSKIQWTDHTFNPWVGCSKISPGCDHCYAESWAKRTGKPELWSGERRRTTAANWRLPLKWDKAAEAEGARKKVFCASLADVFDNQVPHEWRADLWELIARTPNLDWLLLTKRPQNIKEMLYTAPQYARPWNVRFPWPNVWIGTTVENQEEADRRIPLLLEVPAVVRFLSCEPLIDAVTIFDMDGPIDVPFGTRSPLHWVIVGGESGPGARPFSVDWAREIIDQCIVVGADVFVKQVGARPRGDWGNGKLPQSSDHPAHRGEWILRDRKGGDMSEWPADIRLQEFPR